MEAKGVGAVTPDIYSPEPVKEEDKKIAKLEKVAPTSAVSSSTDRPKPPSQRMPPVGGKTEIIRKTHDRPSEPKLGEIIDRLA